MTRARAGAAAAMVIMFLALIPAAPASAAANMSVTITAPANGSTSTSASVRISGSAAIDTGLLSKNDITGVSIAVHGAVAPTCTGSACGFTYVQGQASASFSFQPVLPSNGSYSAAVTVTANEYLLGTSFPTAHAPQTATVAFKVGAAPAAPSGVRAVANADRSVTVSWSRNTEPDITGYQVQRQAPADSAPKPLSGLIAPGAPLTFTDTDTVQTGGHYLYVVYAARAGADPGTSNWLSARSGAVGVDVPAPPPPTTLPPLPDGTPAPIVQAAPTTLGNGAGGGGGPASTLDLSGFLAKPAGGGTTPKLVTPGVPKAITPAAPGEADGGFQPTLPFPLTAGRGAKGAGTQGALGAQPAGSSGTRRTILLPFAAGLFLCVVGVHVRWFNKRLDPDGADPSLLPVEEPTGSLDILPSPAPAVSPAPPRAPAPKPTTPASPLDQEDVLVTW